MNPQPRGRVFRDRAEAGRMLGERLRTLEPAGGVLVLGLARGGVPVARPIADRLDASLDVFVVRKIGMPGQPELAAGAIASGGAVVYNDSLLERLGIREPDLAQTLARERDELARRERRYRANLPPIDAEDKTVVLVDDGIATGATMRVAVKAARSLKPRAVTVAAPTASRDAVAALEQEADQVVALSVPDPYTAVGAWYENFAQVEDEEVRELLEAA